MREAARPLRLDDALLAILVRQEERLFPPDRATLELSCGACGRRFEAGFCFEHSPYAGAVGAALYLTFEEACGACAALLDAREGSIDPDDWQRARRCACEGPAHLVRAVGARLVRRVLGAGATAVLDARRDVPEVRLWRVPHGGLPEGLEPTATGFVAAFGRPLSLFDACAGAMLPGPSRTDLEPGVDLWLATDNGALTDALEPMTRERPRVIVGLDPETVRSTGWPLATLSEHVLGGGGAALVIDRAALHDQLAAAAAPHGGRIQGARPERVELRFGELVGLVYPHRVARTMASYGLTLADAVGLALDETLTGLERIERFLGHVREARPRVEITVEGGLAAVTREDDTRGPPFALESLPVHLERGSRELEREVRYLCDPLPPWSDATRVCTCGAPAWVSHRLLPHRTVAAAAGTPEHAPWVLETWEREGEPRAVDVVVVECDQHRRLLPRRELQRAGLDGAELARRLAQDRERARFAVDVEVVEDAEGARALVARGPLAASVLLEAAWVAGLRTHAGSLLHAVELEAWAFAPDGVCVLDARFRAEERDRLALVTRVRSGLPAEAPPPFSIRRLVSSAPAEGYFASPPPRRVLS